MNICVGGFFFYLHCMTEYLTNFIEFIMLIFRWKGKSAIDLKLSKIVCPSKDPLACGEGFDVHTSQKSSDKGRVFTFLPSANNDAMSYGFINAVSECIAMQIVSECGPGGFDLFIYFHDTV